MKLLIFADCGNGEVFIFNMDVNARKIIVLIVFKEIIVNQARN